VGQFARFVVVCGLVPLARACDAGHLFRAVLSMYAVQAFLSYFQLRCSASTVLARRFIFEQSPSTRSAFTLV
jgi:hypothetical protein